MARMKPALIALALLLAACTSGTKGGSPGLFANTGSVYWTYYDASYTPISDVSIAGGSGQLLTQILGNPFNVDQEQFDKGVTDAMYGAHFGPRTHFTTEPTGSFKRIFYVRLGFGGPNPLSINTICSVPPAPPERASSSTDKVTLAAAFCQSGEPLSYLEAGGSGYTGPNDPRFVAFMQEVTFNLFPPQNSTLRRGQPGNCQWAFC